MKKPMKRSTKKPKKYQLTLTFTIPEMRAIREEVADRRLDTKKSMADRLLYSAAWTFHQELKKIGMPV